MSPYNLQIQVPLRLRKIEDSFSSICSGLQAGPPPTSGVTFIAFLSLLRSAVCPPPDTLTFCSAVNFRCWRYVICFLMFFKASSSFFPVCWLIISSFRASITSLRGQWRWCLKSTSVYWIKVWILFPRRLLLLYFLHALFTSLYTAGSFQWVVS